MAFLERPPRHDAEELSCRTHPFRLASIPMNEVGPVPLSPQPRPRRELSQGQSRSPPEQPSSRFRRLLLWSRSDGSPRKREGVDLRTDLHPALLGREAIENRVEGVELEPNEITLEIPGGMVDPGGNVRRCRRSGVAGRDGLSSSGAGPGWLLQTEPGSACALARELSCPGTRLSCSSRSSNRC